jgi:hypothetical protein
LYHRLGKKKGKIIREFISNWIQSKIINGIITRMNLPSEVVFAINVMTNLDKISIIQSLISQIGIYKYIFYVLYFGLIA